MGGPKRDADAVVRSKIPSIRSYEVDSRFSSPTESEPTIITTLISSATTTAIAKTWPGEIKTMTIANTGAAHVNLGVQIYDTAGTATLGYIFKGLKLNTGTTLVLNNDDIYVPDGDEIKIITAAWTSGTPVVDVIIKF